MRRFSSYGPINTNSNYYAPRQELISLAYQQLLGDNYAEGGHYITVWAPRQTGKTWVMMQILLLLQKDPRFHVLKINLENVKDQTEPAMILNMIARKISEGLHKTTTNISTQDQFQELFRKEVLAKPLILILDEFDSLPEQGINAIVSTFRNIHIARKEETNLPTDQKTYLLHAVALIGVRSVVGVENQKGSPFNVQRSLHIDNLTLDEVKGMFAWYQKESGQTIDPPVVDALFKETNGQPGLTCWLAELLTEGCNYYKNDTSKPIGINEFKKILHLANDLLPNNNIINLISKAKIPPYKNTVIELFKTDNPMKFKFDDDVINYLYMNGIVEPENISSEMSRVKFASPFVQKRLFNYFSNELFKDMGQLVENIFSAPEYLFPDRIDIPVLLQLYQQYLRKNKSWLFKNAPRRSDMRLYEAVYHFNFYSYLDKLLWEKNIYIYPEFPTGNGKIDILIRYDRKDNSSIHYGIELKSFLDQSGYRVALTQAAQYGKQLGLKEIYMVSFIEYIDEAGRKKFEVPFCDAQTGVTVYPVFIQAEKTDNP